MLDNKVYVVPRNLEALSIKFADSGLHSSALNLVDGSGSLYGM
jgi:hypothetical protein